jgi:hypothetical protein
VHCQCGSGLVGGLQTVRARGYTYRRMRCAACNRCSIRADGLEAYVRGALERALGDKGFRSQFGADGLEHAKDVLDAARAERKALRSKVRASDPDFADWLAASTREVETAQAEYQRLAGLANQFNTLPYASELDDPDAFLRGLRALASRGRFVVAYAAKGARIPVEDRVTYVLHGRDDVAGMLAA